MAATTIPPITVVELNIITKRRAHLDPEEINTARRLPADGEVIQHIAAMLGT